METSEILLYTQTQSAEIDGIKYDDSGFSNSNYEDDAWCHRISDFYCAAIEQKIIPLRIKKDFVKNADFYCAEKTNRLYVTPSILPFAAQII